MSDKLPKKTTPEQGEVLLYQTEDGGTRIEVRMVDETVWLTQDQMAELYGKSKSTINEHVKNVYEEHELSEETTLRKFGNSEFSTTQEAGSHSKY